MSPCFERDSVGIHFTWKKDRERVGALLPRIESMLAPFEPRPHWAKLFALHPAVLRSRYPLLDKFNALRRRYDPEGKFMNAYLRRLL
jgi:xylitol oxidase